MASAALAVCASLAFAGCAQQDTKPADEALAALQARLPGRYDNIAQVRSETASGQPGAALDLQIIPADAALVGKTVYYVRESAAGDPRRVLSQYIWVFGRGQELSGKQSGGQGKQDRLAPGYLEQHIYRLKEPQRWLAADAQPELLQSLLPDDLQRLTGCELLWTRKGADFTAERRSSSCSPSARTEGQLIEQRIELHENRLALLEQQIAPEGLLDAPAGPSDPWYRFVRRGGAN